MSMISEHACSLITARRVEDVRTDYEVKLRRLSTKLEKAQNLAEGYRKQVVELKQILRSTS